MAPNKYALALHTTSPELGLAVSNFAGDSRCQTWDLGWELSTQLHLLLAEFMPPQTWSDLAFIAAAKGPGSFTGTRIGVVTARTLAQQLDIPLFAISTLAAVAHSQQLAQAFPDSAPIAVQMPAMRGQIFAGIYQPSGAGGLTPLFPDTALTPEAWQQTLDKLAHTYHLIRAEQGLATAASLLQLAYLDWQQGLRPHWSEALPFYGQHPVETAAGHAGTGVLPVQ